MPKARTNPRLKKLCQLAKQQLPALGNKPNVRYVTVGRKWRNGKLTNTESVIVYVSSKQKKIAKQDRIPKTLPGRGKKAGTRIRTDVVELPGEPTAFGARSGHILRGFDADIGICGLAFVKNNRRYLMTNAHVACDIANGGVASRVSILNRENGSFVDAGPVVYATPLRPGVRTDDDTAIIDAQNITVDNMQVLDLAQPIIGFGSFAEVLNATYWYSINGGTVWCEHPEPLVGDALIKVDGVWVPYSGFWQLRVSRGAVQPGHSGAVLLRTHPNGFVACGLLFGGNQPSLVYALPIIPSFQRAWERLP